MKFLLAAVLTGALLFPPLSIIHGYPKVELSILLLPIILVFALKFHKEAILDTIRKNKTPLLFLTFFILTIILSIIINKRVSIIRDWFEVVKFIEFGTYIVLFQAIFDRSGLKQILKILFAGVLLFNFLHYFNIFDFNQIIEPFYAHKHHLDRFGLNSLGLPATKRALGVLGNPNNNAVLFLLFLWVFVPKKPEFKFQKLVLPTLAILGIFLCQSRTGLIAFSLSFLLYLWSIRTGFMFMIYFLLFSLAVFLLLHSSGNTYLSSVAKTAIVSKAGEGRMSQWERILNAMPGHWLFGNAPNKTYFEQHGIHSESEYFLILFRYGIVGLITYITFWFSLLYNFCKTRKRIFSLILYVVFSYFILAITNNPMHSPKLMLMFACVIALNGLYPQKNEAKKI